MKLTAILFFLALSVSAQDVIDFKLLAEKKVKSTANYTVSDASIDFKNIDHQGSYYVRFTGEFPKRLLLKNFIGMKIILEGTTITAPASENKSLQLADCKRSIVELGTVTGNAASTGICGQSVYLYGKWQNMTFKGGLLHQNGNSGGAAFQSESYSDPNYSHGKLVIDGLTVTKAMGEGIYNLYNQPTKAYLDTLIIRNTTISNTRRDFWQQANVRYTIYENNKGENGGLEMNSDHVSGFSLNGKNTLVILRKNRVGTIPQFIYSSTQSTVYVDSNRYDQGNHAGPRVNQAIYSKAIMYLKSNIINTPAAKEAVVTVDGGTLNWDISSTFVGPKQFRYFNGGKSIEHPFVTTSTDTITVKTSATSTEPTKTQYFTSSGVELVPKQP
jgi:hypothetical protein